MSATDTTSLVGHSFGALTVLRRVALPFGARDAYWLCRCQACACVRPVRAKYLRHDTPTTCRCEAAENRRIASLEARDRQRDAGVSRTDERCPWDDPQYRPDVAGTARRRAATRIRALCAEVDRMPAMPGQETDE